MVLTLTTLPEVIFRLLQTILTNDDYHYLLNTSKQHFSDLKRRTIYFRLNEVKSKQYMIDKEFQSYVLSLVEDGWKQIRVNWDPPRSRKWESSSFMSWYDPEVPSDYSEFIPELATNFFSREMNGILPLSSNLPRKLNYLRDIKSMTSLGDISHLTKLKLTSLNKILDLSLFQHIPDLEINSTACDVTIFNKNFQKRLILIYCRNLTNVESFKGIHNLQIVACDSIEDISALYGIYDLSLISCRNIKDISKVGNHHRLQIERCAENLFGYESLEGIPHITLTKCDISDVNVLRDAKSVKLQYCDKIFDISPLKKVKKVELYESQSIINIIELCNVYDLSIDESVFTESDLTKLRNYQLSITFFLMDHIKGHVDKPYDKYFDQCFSLTSHLTLRNVPMCLKRRFEEGNLYYLNHLQSLKIACSTRFSSKSFDYSCCFQFPRGLGLENIPVVILDYLEIKTVAGFSNNHCVKLLRCIGIQDIASLSSVKVLTIDCCFNSNSSVFSKVPRFKWFDEST